MSGSFQNSSDSSSNALLLTGDQTADGNKTFSGNLNLSTLAATHTIIGAINATSVAKTHSIAGILNLPTVANTHTIAGNLTLGSANSTHSITGALSLPSSTKTHMVAGLWNITNTTGSTASATGALVVAGGVGIGGAINAGSSSSNHVLNGNVYIGTLSIGNNHTISGNLTVGTSSASNHNFVGTVTIGSSSSQNQTIIGNLTVGSSTTNNHSIVGTLTLSSTTNTHVIVGNLSVGKVLTTAGRKSALTTKSVNYTTVVTDEFILVDATAAARTITLLAAATAGSGAKITVQKTDSSANTVNVTPVLSGGNLTAQYQSENYISNGTNWYKY
jgi:hypothetical protein